MAFTIRSTTAFAAGQIILQNHTFNVADDGLVSARFSFACLGTSAVVAAAMRKFIVDMPPPVALPADMTALRLETGNIYLSDVSSRIENGICYIEANYVGSNADQARRVTESWTTRSFNGTILGEYTVAGTLIATVYGSINFDYTAVSRTVSWTVIGAQGDVALDAQPVNIRNKKETILPAAVTVFKRGKGYMVEQVASLQTSRVGRVTRIQKTVTGEYVSDNDGFKLLREDRRSTEIDLGPMMVG